MDLPYLTADLPGVGGVLRTHDDDFVVDEEPAYLPCGTGDHVYVRIEKRGMTTSHAVDRIARALAVSARDIGVAGLKDRHAVTRQWLSLPPPLTPELVEAARGALGRPTLANGAEVCDLVILDINRHGNKLRTGHVRANRFQLRVRGVADEAAARAREILERLAAPPGAPNWYGEQRFGRDGDNAARGRAIVMGASPPRDRKLARLLVSSLQSQLFNDWLVARIADGLYGQALAGDILHKREGGQFTCEDAATDSSRLAAGELAITGPMFGDRMRRPPDGTPAAEREEAILAAAQLSRDSFGAVRAIAEGTRRDATIEVGEPTTATLGPDLIEVCFTLPGGAYATAVMREIMKA